MHEDMTGRFIMDPGTTFLSNHGLVINGGTFIHDGEHRGRNSSLTVNAGVLSGTGLIGFSAA